METRPLRGVLTALVTPFTEQGALDMPCFERLVDRQLEGGVHGLVPCGTTGETPALDDDEWAAVVKSAITRAAGRVPVVPGTGTNNTRHSIERTKRARDMGADAALVVTPYYNKPNPDGLVAHFHAIADQGGLPVVVYNVPGRTGQNVAPELVLRIAEHPRVVAVKEASGVLGQAMTLIRDRKAGFRVLSGEDDLTCAMTLMGGDGVISVLSNVDPRGFSAMIDAALAGDVKTALAEHYRLLEVGRTLFIETNPVPAKAALALMGLAPAHVRPPLAPASAATVARMRAALAAAGLLPA